LDTTELFFEEAARAGFGTVVAVYRKNVVAREVSSVELTKNEFEKELARFTVSFIDSNLKAYQDGIDADGRAGFLVKELSFADVTTNTCSTLSEIFYLLRKHKKRTRFQRDVDCELVVSPHVKHIAETRTKTLEERLGEKNAAIVREQLVGTKHECMLDLNALDPNHQRPTVPDAT